MDIRVVKDSIINVESDALIVNLFEGVTSPGGATGAVDKILDGIITSLISDGEITGKLMEITVLHTSGIIPPKRILVAGLGKSNEFTTGTVRKVSGAAIRFLRDRGIKTVTSIIHGAGIGSINAIDASRAVVEGTLTGLFRSDLYKTHDNPNNQISMFTIVENDSSKITDIEKGMREGKILGDAINHARAMGNEPSNIMTPAFLSEQAKKIGTEFALDYEEFDLEKLQHIGMNGIVSVGKGSINSPKLIMLRYNISSDKPTLAIIGKAITFDSGGISIKPDSHMCEMKFDMAGGAAVLGAMQAIAQLKLDINVIGLVPAAENMPSGSAYKPGDIIKCYNGKTVEITTTDAEGRMILSDAIAYAVEQEADYIVDIATLTGGCVVALGNDITGIMGNNQNFIDRLRRVSEITGERVWQLPLPSDYKEMLKSTFADMINADGRSASAIQGGLFLQEFADDVPWIHMDIAGTSDISSDGGPAGADKYTSKGATGAGVRNMVMLAMHLAENTFLKE